MVTLFHDMLHKEIEVYVDQQHPTLGQAGQPNTFQPSSPRPGLPLVAASRPMRPRSMRTSKPLSCMAQLLVSFLPQSSLPCTNVSLQFARPIFCTSLIATLYVPTCMPCSHPHQPVFHPRWLGAKYPTADGTFQAYSRHASSYSHLQPLHQGLLCTHQSATCHLTPFPMLTYRLRSYNSRLHESLRSDSQQPSYLLLVNRRDSIQLNNNMTGQL